MKNQTLMISFLIAMIMISSLASVKNMKFTNTEGENMVTSVSYSLAKTENNADSEMFAKNFKSPTYVDHLVPTKDAKGETTIVEEIKSDANYYDGHKNLSFIEVNEDEKLNDDDENLKEEQEDLKEDPAKRGASTDVDNNENDDMSNLVSDEIALKDVASDDAQQRKYLNEAELHNKKFQQGPSGEGIDNLVDNDNHEDDTNMKKSYRKATPKVFVDNKAKSKDTTVGNVRSESKWGTQSKPVKREDVTKRAGQNAAEKGITANGQEAGGRRKDITPEGTDANGTNRKDEGAAVQERGQGEPQGARHKGHRGDQIDRKNKHVETFTYTPNTDEGDQRKASKKQDTGNVRKTKKEETPLKDTKVTKRKNKTTLSSRKVHQIPSLGDDSHRQTGTTRIVEKVCNEYTDHVEACKNTGKCGWCANKNACMPQSSAGLKACQVGQFKLVKFTENFNPYPEADSIVKKHEYSDGDLVFINPKPKPVVTQIE
jgi:hypothetical protein